MSLPERHKVDELVALYELEPSLRDVYVEGETDEAFFDWFFSHVGTSKVEVKGIRSVDVPAEAVARYDCEVSNRGRLITLAHELEKELGSGALNVTCVVDADFDLVLEKSYHCALLLLTDYSSLELYSFTTSTLSKLLKVVVMGFPQSGAAVITAIRVPLIEAFALRMTNKVLGWNMPWQPIEKCCEVAGSVVKFDTKKYISRYLQAAGRFGDRQQFQEALGRSRGMLKGDERRFIHGHDFVDMLVWYLRQHKGFRSVSKLMIERALFACIESGSIASEPTLRALLQRTAP